MHGAQTFYFFGFVQQICWFKTMELWVRCDLFTYFFALVVWNKKDCALYFDESAVHMTLTPFQTGGRTEQGCLLEHRGVPSDASL